MISVRPIASKPAVYPLSEADPSGETTITVKHATFGDEGARMTMFSHFGDGPVAMTRVAAVELWLTLDACNITNEETGEPLLKAGMPYAEFDQALTAIWQANPDAVWEMHARARDANPQWNPEGNA